MTAPASFDRVYAALRRLQPPVALSDSDDSMVQGELRAIAWVLGRAVDYWDGLLPGLLLESDQLLSRWEDVLRLGQHPGDPFAQRTVRMLPVLRRRLTYSRARLASALAPLLGVNAESLSWIEVLREDIEAGLTSDKVYPGGGAAVAAGAGPGFVAIFDRPWPSVVDEVGVAVIIRVATADATDITIRLRHASGKSDLLWNGVAGSLDEVKLWARSAFLGLPARGPWRVEVSTTGAHGAAAVNDCHLMVSNDEDSSQIYTGFCLRDVAYGVLTSVVPAQRMIEKAGIAHAQARVIERDSVLCDDAHSLTDREPVGS